MKFPDNIPMPNNMTKKEILDILLLEEYGAIPPAPDLVTAEELESDDTFCASRVSLKKIKLTCKMGEKLFSYPIHYACSKTNEVRPCIIHINFRSNVPDKYQPTEEIFDNGYNIVTMCYEDITKDNPDFTDGLAGVLYPDGNRPKGACGKIGLWAWAALRVFDFVYTLPETDKEHIIVAGHSRLGKTALLTGALEERIFCAYSNDSGCSGAAISRDKQGERIEDICRVFGYWFNADYSKYANNENSLPFDQHYLLCANSPHRVYVGSAVDDLWADPKSEYKACVLASEYFKAQGKNVELKQEMPDINEYQHNGYIGYHIRSGGHYLSREDWNIFLEYIKKCY